MRRVTLALLAFCALPMAACQIYTPTPSPDYTIKVMPTAQGMVAIPPTCPNWATDITDPYDNQPVPQFGCSTSRNLAMMAENPEDVANGRNLGPTRGVAMVGAVRRYDNNQTRGLVATSSAVDSSVDVTTAPNANSPMSGDATGAGATGAGTGSTAASSSAASGP